MTAELKIISINIVGIKSVERRQILLNFCRVGKFDIVGLQEVAFHSCPIIENHYHLLAYVGPNKNGTAILIRHGLDYSRMLLEPDGRLISIYMKYFTPINIYAPSGIHVKNERNKFLRQTVPAYTTTTRLPFGLMGDFNCVDDIHKDRSKSPSLPVKPNVINYALKEMVTGLDLVDIWKKLNINESGLLGKKRKKI
jgi:exonuclease III